MQKKAKRDPVHTLPARKFFGEYYGRIIAPESRLKNSATAWARPEIPALDDFAFKGRSSLRKAVELLQDASGKADIEGFRRLLYHLLTLLHIRIPKGAIPTSFPPGRPSEELATKAGSEWVNMGRPVMSWRVKETIARKLCPDEFSQSQNSPEKRKRLRDKIGAAVNRYSLTRALQK